MVNFVKNYKKSLPYNKENYLSYFDAESESNEKWYGVSIQAVGYKSDKDYLFNSDKDYLFRFMREIFERLINQYDEGVNWTISHDDKDMKWLPNFPGKTLEVLVPTLTRLFAEHGIRWSFKGAIRFPKQVILGPLLKDLIAYPFVLSYKNLDVSHRLIPLIIKITGHLTIDVLSLNEEIIDQVKLINFSPNYSFVPYR